MNNFHISNEWAKTKKKKKPFTLVAPLNAEKSFFVELQCARKKIAPRLNTTTQQCGISLNVVGWISTAIAINCYLITMRYRFNCSLAFVWHLFCFVFFNANALYNQKSNNNCVNLRHNFSIWSKEIWPLSMVNFNQIDIKTELKSLEIQVVN